MKLRLVLVLSFVLGLLQLDGNAQAVLKGVVSRNVLGGAPLVGVSVSGEGANPQRTQVDGTFILRFLGKSPGERPQRRSRNRSRCWYPEPLS